jgi:hypothetical protein
MACKIQSPVEKIPPQYKGGPGEYNGEKGYPKRTGGAGGPSEKVRDGSAKSPKKY